MGGGVGGGLDERVLHEGGRLQRQVQAVALVGVALRGGEDLRCTVGGLCAEDLDQDLRVDGCVRVGGGRDTRTGRDKCQARGEPDMSYFMPATKSMFKHTGMTEMRIEFDSVCVKKRKKRNDRDEDQVVDLMCPLSACWADSDTDDIMTAVAVMNRVHGRCSGWKNNLRSGANPPFNCWAP